MARVILVTGGARSGKSTHAVKLAEKLTGARLYIATCPPLDEEIKERIRKHRAARQRGAWKTVEEPLYVAQALRVNPQCEVVLVDCLTLWVNNLLHEAGAQGKDLSEDDAERRCRELLSVCAEREGTVIFVTNEVGMGIVPADATTRRFRDLAGRCNQVMAEGADVVTLMVCGVPLQVKGERTNGST